MFKQKKEAGEHNLKIGTIFSYKVNEDDKDVAGNVETDIVEGSEGETNVHSRENLESFIQDYNTMYGSNFDTNNFYGYYQDIGKRVKNRQIDILLVVNMFLTGFDSQTLNTIYVDKNLKYHGLIQAYSRTNRILGTVKSQGNVVCFRNLKSATDKAIELFANKEAAEDIILQPYEHFVEKFCRSVDAMRLVAPTVDSVNELQTEEEQAKFIHAFRELMRIRNILICFTEFSFDNLNLDEQQFEDYKSKYLDLYEKVKSDRQKEKVSILDDVDFELELIHRDEINVGYILNLLQQMHSAESEEQQRIKEVIKGFLDSERQLRSKKELITRFIEQQLPDIPDDGNIRESFDDYWDREKELAMQDLADTEKLKLASLRRTIDRFLFTERLPTREETIELMQVRPGLIQRRRSEARIIDKIKLFVETFFDGVD